MSAHQRVRRSILPSEAAQMVVAINQLYRDGNRSAVENYKKIGGELLKLKEAAGHGGWLLVFERRHVPFSIDVAQRYMAIAAYPPFRKTATLRNLPPSRTTLAALTKLAPPRFEELLTEGKIHREMTHAEALMLVQPRREFSGPVAVGAAVTLVAPERTIEPADVVHVFRREPLVLVPPGDGFVDKTSRPLSERVAQHNRVTGLIASFAADFAKLSPEDQAVVKRSLIDRLNITIADVLERQNRTPDEDET